jgi:hypothetical protein
MRARFLFVAGMALLLSSCSGGGSHSLPPLDKKLLTGKWKATSDSPFMAGREFAEDGTMRTTIQGMEQPLSGRYTWDGDRTLDLEYQDGPDVQKAYRAAAKAYKEGVMNRIQAGSLPDRAGPSILSTVRDEPPARETLRVGISDRPRLLILSGEDGGPQTFEKAD